MTTTTTETLTVTIDAPPERVTADLADPAAHPEWATEFFAGKAEPLGDTEARVRIPMIGGDARLRVEADVPRGIVDLYLAPADAPYGPALPVRVVPNGEGADVLWTLARQPGMPDEAWDAALASMRRELDVLRRRLEG
ncbi:MAG TPA: hypothetical protein VGW10_13415 [Solirubrobacteraceae bacterium]|nr:hypothetical protein [Solirubrobacteraceae bacterium]